MLPIKLDSEDVRLCKGNGEELITDGKDIFVQGLPEISGSTDPV